MNFEELIAKRAMGHAEPKDYSAWAETLLYEHVASENIAILASMGYERDPEREEVESYFLKSIRDLGLVLPNEKDGVKLFAVQTVNEIVAGKLDARVGVAKMEALYSYTDYDPIYGVWDYLNDDISMIEHNGACYFNSGLDSSNIDEYIKGVAAQFLDVLEMDLPDGFFNLCACEKCGHIGESGQERVDKPWMPELLFRFLYRRYPASRAVCANCATPYPPNMTNFLGRKLYIGSKC